MSPDVLLHAVLSVVLLGGMIPACQYLDRQIGLGKERSKHALEGTLLFGATALAFGIWWLPAILFTLCFLAWRTPGFGNNVIVPSTSSEKKATFFRHTIYSLPIVAPAYLAGAPIWYLPWIAACMIWFGYQALKIAEKNYENIFVIQPQHPEDKHDYNADAELARGKMYGIAVCAAYLPFVALQVTGHVDGIGMQQAVMALFQPRV